MSVAEAPSPPVSRKRKPKKQTKKVNEVAGWRLLVLFPLAFLMRLWCATLRFRFPDESSRQAVEDTSKPLVCLFWHNRLFIAAEAYRRFRSKRRMFGLVSASKDGAWLAGFFKLIGIGAIRGSSSYGGTQAIRDLISALNDGHDITITPDGPRGPLYELKPGAFLVARKSQAPLLLGSCSFSSAWRLKSWDGFYLPKPFSTVTFHCKCYDSLDTLLEKYPETGGAQLLKQELMSMTHDDDPRDTSGS